MKKTFALAAFLAATSFTPASAQRARSAEGVDEATERGQLEDRSEQRQEQARQEQPQPQAPQVMERPRAIELPASQVAVPQPSAEGWRRGGGAMAEVQGAAPVWTGNRAEVDGPAGNGNGRWDRRREDAQVVTPAPQSADATQSRDWQSRAGGNWQQNGARNDDWRNRERQAGGNGWRGDGVRNDGWRNDGRVEERRVEVYRGADPRYGGQWQQRWGSQGWGNQGWGNQGWNNQNWGNQSWNNRGWGSDYNRIWNRDWRRDGQYDWQRYRSYNRDLYRGERYDAPYGWSYGYRRFSIGLTLSNSLFGQRYWIDDPYSYRLPPTYGAYRWVRYYDDVLLIDLRTGRVVDAIYSFFW